MPPVENDPSKPIGSSADPQRDPTAASGSNAEAEGSAAHIAELVRRTAEREASPAGTSAARTEVTVAEPVAPTVLAPTVLPPAPQPGAPRVRHSIRQPSRRFLVAGVAIATVLIAGGLAFASQGGSDTGKTPAPTPAAAAPAAAPAGYAVQVTDEITDCERHSHGRTKTTFKKQNCVKATRTLGNGRVDGRPVLFVVARIQMESDAAATVVRRVLDGTGTGNLNDLLREGKTFTGAPRAMPVSGYASARAGAVVLVAEAGFSDGGPSSNDDPALRAAAAKVAAMLKAQG